MARFGKKLKIEWSNNQLLATLFMLICSGKREAWRGGKKNPHRHGAHRYKPMGDTETQRGEPYAHPIVLLVQTRCQEKSGISDILTPDEMNLLVFIYLQAIIDYQIKEVLGFIGNPFKLDSDCIARIVFFRGQIPVGPNYLSVYLQGPSGSI